MQERRAVNETGVAQFFGKVYGTMGIGILVTAAVTYVLGYVFQAQYFAILQSNALLRFVFTLLPFAFLLMGSSRKALANPGRAMVMFIGLAASEGFMLASVMWWFKGTTVVAALLVTAVIFGTMALVGVYGKKDISRAGGIATMLLYGAILMSFVNIFMGSAGFAMVLNYIILGVFIVLVAYDSQRLRNFYASAEAQGDVAVSSLAIQGAVMLYLDFLNLFITILQIFGVGSDNN
ncbi:Bax inhibitor-1/YccA family protein [Lacticaseibacillus hulanensis]|uniref:Bax inhibitor-1/YccA family protein n=1 Tax=Lacticaseibacillus hulanensis TaxID=2493111 RepID=UPI000FDB86AC|nr:Bax inhibitor-1/YccA family protein [Lacticaseibacillus hulanensis]